MLWCIPLESRLVLKSTLGPMEKNLFLFFFLPLKVNHSEGSQQFSKFKKYNTTYEMCETFRTMAPNYSRSSIHVEGNG